jgi:cyanophycinase-like exopeptidase
MSSFLGLIGGEEFADGFEDVHAGLMADVRRMLEVHRVLRVVYLPTCAADDGDEAVDYWCAIARERLSALGASVETPRVVDTASANDARYAELVANADWIYLGGGYPHVAMHILPNTRVLDALRAAVARGALVTGASGGAMLMCARSWVITPELAAEVGRMWESGVPADWDLPLPSPLDCLGWVPRSICWPHFNRAFSIKWLERGLLPRGFTLIGIDEQTALVSCDGGLWEVQGRGTVTIIRSDLKLVRYSAGDTVILQVHESNELGLDLSGRGSRKETRR